MTSRTNRRRHCLPTVTRKQYRNRVRDLQGDLRQVKHEQAGADRLIDDQRKRIAELEDEVARLRAERVDASVLRQQLTTADTTNSELHARLLATRAELQNATAIDVPPMVRDATGLGEQPTEPIYAEEVRAGLAARAAARSVTQVRTLAEALGAL